MTQTPACVCLQPPFNYQNYVRTELGTDLTNNRHAEVSIDGCRICGKLWLSYFVEYEAFSKSGRWFKGLIPAEKANTIKPEEAVDYLEKLDWYFYGGSYFDSDGKIGKGPVQAD